MAINSSVPMNKLAHTLVRVSPTLFKLLKFLLTGGLSIDDIIDTFN